jgi:hypothetical protein
MAKYQFRVEVQPAYLPEQSAPEQGIFSFSYSITITNTGEVPAQLIARHWVITDGTGGIEEVKGLGVVGHQPLLQARPVVPVRQRLPPAHAQRQHAGQLLLRRRGRRAVRAWWAAFIRDVDLTTLLADYGFAPRTAFLSELTDRLRRKLLPGTPETTDASELFRMVLPGDFDARWIALLDDTALARIGAVLADAPIDTSADDTPRWRHTVMDAVTYCSSQVVAAGFSPELRLRMSDAARAARPFHALMAELDDLRDAMFDKPHEEAELQSAFIAFRDRLDACRAGASSVYTHLEDHGISVGLVFRVRQLRERVLRIRELLDCLMAPAPHASVARLVGRLVAAGGERNSLRALVATNSSMLAAKVTERSAEAGEHYITRDRGAYLQMVRKAAGGGALTALTVLLKFGILALGLSAFWAGLGAGLMYAASFVAIQLLHLTLATKQLWGQWLRPSAGLPTVQWSLLLAAAAIAGHLVQRYMGLPKVVGYSIVGTLAGLAGFSGAAWPLQGIGAVPAGAGRVGGAVRDRRPHRAALVPPQPDGAAAKRARIGADLCGRLCYVLRWFDVRPAVADAVALIAIAPRRRSSARW